MEQTNSSQSPQSTTPETPDSTQQLPQTAPKQRKVIKKIFITFAIIFFIFLISAGVGAYFLAKELLPSSTTNITQGQDAAKILSNPVVKKMIQSAPIPKVTMIPITVTITPTNTENITTKQSVVTNWKTYTNDSYKFSINYPGNETYQENNHGLGVIDVVFFDSTQGGSADSPDYQFLLFPKSIGSIIGQDFDQLYNLPSPSAQILKINNQSQQFTKLQNLTIDNLRAFRFQSTSYPTNANEEAQIGNYIEIGDSILTISTGQNNQATLTSMMNSFKYSP